MKLHDLTIIPESLLNTVTKSPDPPFNAPRAPLHRCGTACQEYGALIDRGSKHLTESRSIIRDWMT